jgi:site-specific DNA-methyltransferase (adenine-specific)
MKYTEFWKKLNGEFGFTLDACANSRNKRCRVFFSEATDGLKQDWEGNTVWCNPPLGAEMGRWIEKSAIEAGKGATVVMFVPEKPEGGFKCLLAKHGCDIETRAINVRIESDVPQLGIPHPMMLLIFRKKAERPAVSVPGETGKGREKTNLLNKRKARKKKSGGSKG